MLYKELFGYFCIFTAGLIIGRITMAIQYTVMKSCAKAKSIAPSIKPNNTIDKPDIQETAIKEKSRPSEEMFQKKYYVSIRKPLNDFF